jgi:acyl dehydratase
MRTFENIDQFAAAKGELLGPGDWAYVDQARINLFAEATGDHQWIHVDPERAESGPFGGTVAHGFLTLSLLSELLNGLYRVENVTMAINYGLNRVRFPAPVRAGSRIRARSQITGITLLASAVQGEFATVIEIEDSEKPACVAQTIARYYP